MLTLHIHFDQIFATKWAFKFNAFGKSLFLTMSRIKITKIGERMGDRKTEIKRPSEICWFLLRIAENRKKNITKYL